LLIEGCKTLNINDLQIKIRAWFGVEEEVENNSNFSLTWFKGIFKRFVPDRQGEVTKVASGSLKIELCDRKCRPVKGLEVKIFFEKMGFVTGDLWE